MHQQARVDAGFTGGARVGRRPVHRRVATSRLRKNLIDFGPRREDATRETTRIVLGVDGQMTENWNYEVAAQLRPVSRKTRSFSAT